MGDIDSDTRIEGARGEGAKRPAVAAGRVTDVVVWTDGYVGEVGAGWAFVAQPGGVVRRGALPACPSHEAEWRAVREALSWAEAALAPGDALELRTDSALVAKGLASRRPAMSGEAAEARAACRQALARLGQRGVKARVQRIGREENVEADGQARLGAGQR
ncbi:MAG: Reverse transcriptase-like [Thermoplasmata archaeon]|jgi:ribonuclease HI|nr:Reverse transcriptase-like [Thermoplasmata archaeon]